jgi:inner membrane protein
MMRWAVLCGITAGMAPDLDVLIREAGNPMLGLGFHRHFTHALVFAPLGALVVAGALWPLIRKHLQFRWIYLFCLMGFFMHGVLDALTNYGTHLFWPFTNRRESWSIISIIDPIFTLTLLAFVVIAAWKRARRVALAGAGFALVYWGMGYYQREQATAAMQALAASRQHTVERFEVKPSLGNILLWRGQYLAKGNIYIDAFHVSPWRGRVPYEGGSLPVYQPPKNLSPTQQRDLDYFTFFSDGWVALAPNQNGLIGDARFAMLPDQTMPIWGIRLQPDKPDSHVLFENIRSRKEGDVDRLWTMIQGHALSND